MSEVSRYKFNSVHRRACGERFRLRFPFAAAWSQSAPVTRPNRSAPPRRNLRQLSNRLASSCDPYRVALRHTAHQFAQMGFGVCKGYVCHVTLQTSKLVTYMSTRAFSQWRNHPSSTPRAASSPDRASVRFLNQGQITTSNEIRTCPEGEVSSNFSYGKNGGCWGIRTHDPLIKSQLLYQLSYAPAVAPVQYQARRRGRGKYAKTRPWQGV